MRSFLDRSTAVGILFLGHNLRVSLLPCIARFGNASLAHSRSWYGVSTRRSTSMSFKIHAFVNMTPSTRRFYAHDSSFSTHNASSGPSSSSASTNFSEKINPNMKKDISQGNPSCPNSETSTPHHPSSVASQGDSTNESKDAPYTQSEIRDFLLLLLPESTTGVQSISIKEALHQLPAEMQEMVRKHPGGLARYVQEHFSTSIRVAEDGQTLLRVSVPQSPQGKSDDAQNPPPHVADKKISLRPPPPPQPNTTLTEAPLPPSDAASPDASSPHPSTNATPETRSFRNKIEILDALVEYIPTFFVNQEVIASMLPPDIQALYADTSLTFFLKRFKHYFNTQTNFGNTTIRLKEDFSHPKRGIADARYATCAGSAWHMESRGRPPRNSEANLIISLLPRVPKVFQPFSEVLQEISDLVSRHPAFDSRLGVMGFLEKYPEYFQVAEGKLRVRPYSVALNALDELDATSSPFPEAFTKIMTLVDSVAKGKVYDNENGRISASVSTSKLYAMLTDKERSEIRAAWRSFPRFLRLHGKAIVVSADSMSVYKFKPEYERCAETILNPQLSEMEIAPNDPVLAIPFTMDEKTNADWVLRELYNALPLIQCAELEDVLVLVPDAVRKGLPQDMNELVSLLSEFPDYFDIWPYPDNPSVMIIQRAKVGIPVFEKDEIVKKVLPLIPQEGIKLSTLKSRVPLPMQRYFYRYGVSKTLGEMDQVFCITTDLMIRIV
ncbi:unnamed protein product [Phytomonas sp. Hart1]|nr:unnamed protein product [Phytomonas sp. Hart1]|eukprot:CCW68659.1 unnamed protein product [Phytomonas sp. isolate Hart1]